MTVRAKSEAKAYSVGLVLLLAWLVFMYALNAFAEVPGVPEEGIGTAKALYEAVQGGQWWYAAALVLSLGVWALRKFGAKYLPAKVSAFVGSDRGGVVLTLASAVLMGVVHALYAKVPFGPEWFETVIKIASGAIGGYVGLRKLLWPSDKADPAPVAPGVGV